MKSNPSFIYFGGDPLGAPTLATLSAAGLKPTLVVCNPNRPSGRDHKLTSPATKIMADQLGLPTLQPESLTPEAITLLTAERQDLFVVVAYNHILPPALLKHPDQGCLNLHPSLLPKLRGASPIRSAILLDKPEWLGVSVMLLDERMDHGPLLAQEKLSLTESTWPVPGQRLDTLLTEAGGRLLVDTIPKWLNGELTPHPQDDEQATYSRRLQREDGRLILDPFQLPEGDEAWTTLLKIRAFDGFPGTFFIYNQQRIKVIEAGLEANRLQLITILPEGKRAQPFSAWLKTAVR